MGRDIAAAVKAGKLSREEAHKKSKAIRKWSTGQSGRKATPQICS